MLRRRLLTLVLCLFAAGFALAAEAASAMQADHMCMQQDANAADCGNDGTAANACDMHCAVGACIASAVSSPQFMPPALQPSGRETVPVPASRSAPDTAPPKASIS